MRFFCLFTLAVAAFTSLSGNAQELNIVTNDSAGTTKTTVKLSQPKRFYFGNGLDMAMLSTAFFSKPGRSTQLTVPRFTTFVNLGFTVNYDFSKNFGLLTGLGLRNMGFIEKQGDSTIKKRVYALGIPLGIKIGDLRNRNFVFLGGAIDLPFNYREKAFISRGNKEKFNEWFSDRTPRIMPSVFVGYSFDPGITFKLQYYPGNFLNTDYEQIRNYNGTGPHLAIPEQPYAGYKVNLLLLSLGIDIHYNQYKIQEREYQKQKKEEQNSNVL